ncbi:hypothetical protein OAW27_00185 [bacterium]|nr:hypothetical protein [bacterium]
MTNIDPDIHKILENLKSHEQMHNQVGLNSLMGEDPILKSKSSVWVNIKSIFYTVVTIIALIASLLILPLALFFITIAVVYGVYKIVFTVKDSDIN